MMDSGVVADLPRIDESRGLPPGENSRKNREHWPGPFERIRRSWATTPESIMSQVFFGSIHFIRSTADSGIGSGIAVDGEGDRL